MQWSYSSLALSHRYIHKGACHSTTIAGTTILVPCHAVKQSLDFKKIEHLDSSSSTGHQGDITHSCAVLWALSHSVSLCLIHQAHWMVPIRECQAIQATYMSGIQDNRAHSRFAPSQWETALLCNDISHWLSESLESALRQPPAWPLDTNKLQWKVQSSTNFHYKADKFLDIIHITRHRVGKMLGLFMTILVWFMFHTVNVLLYAIWCFLTWPPVNMTKIKYIQCGTVITRSVSPNSSQQKPHNSPVRASYGVCVVNTNSNLCSVSVSRLLYAISCCTGLCDSGIQLYLAS